MVDITVQPFGQSYQCADGQTLLAAALSQNRLLRYGCQHGGCGSCKVRLVEGDVEEHGSSFALTGQDRSDDLVLACASVPLEPCTIDVEPSGLSEEEFLSGDTSGSFDATVAEVERLTSDITRIRMRLDEDLAFTAGQFVNIEVPGSGALRTFSMANGPDEPRIVELICKIYPGGLFSDYLGRASVGDAVRLHGPFGQLKIRLSHRPILMIAGGSGLAPLLSMLRSLAARGSDRAVTLFFGARSEADLYLVRQITELGAPLVEFDFVPVLSHEWGPDWSGETGMVTDAVARWRERLAHDAYLCGPPAMIEAAVPLLVDRGVRPRNIYFDAFTPAEEPVPI